jgi:putative heme transporter
MCTGEVAAVQTPQLGRRSHVRLGLTVVALVCLIALVTTQRSLIGSSLATLAHLDWAWLPLALALECASIAAFSIMQRRLFRAGEKSLKLRSVMATTMAGNAISASVPLAGPQLGTAYAYRRFTRFGIDSALAGWTLVVSGVASSLAAAVIFVVGSVLLGNDVVAATGAVGGVVGVAVLVVATVALRRPRLQRAVEGWLVWMLARAQRILRLRSGSPKEAVSGFVVRLRTLRLRRRDWGRVLGLALLNWLADAGVLVVSILAVGGGVPWDGLLFVYGVRMAAGGISITPGGLGVVEGALALALISVGLQHPTAVAAVLLYRFVSFWLVNGVGWIVYLLGQAGDRSRSLGFARRRIWAV